MVTPSSCATWWEVMNLVSVATARNVENLHLNVKPVVIPRNIHNPVGCKATRSGGKIRRTFRQPGGAL